MTVHRAVQAQEVQRLAAPGPLIMGWALIPRRTRAAKMPRLGGMAGRSRCANFPLCVDPTPHRGSLGLPLSLVCDAPWPDLHASGCVCCPTIATIMAILNRITVLQVLLFAVGIVVVGTIPAQGQDLH